MIARLLTKRIRMESLIKIQSIPTTIDNVHESAFRSYHILNQVLKMVDRNDSRDSIFEVVELLKSNPIDTELTILINENQTNL